MAASRERFSTALAFAVAPLLPALAISRNFWRGGSVGDNIYFSLLIYAVTLIPTLTLGAAAFSLAHRLDLIRWWSALIIGALIGLLVAMLATSTVGNVWFQPAVFRSAAAGGAVAGFVFWLVWWLGHRG